MDETYSPEIMIDRASNTPLYEQIAQPIEAAILSGELPAGAMIEDEVSMARRLDVARPTARRALQELANKGLLTRRRGVGTRVTPPHVHRPMKLSSLNEDLAEAGFTPTTKVLSYEVREASETEAERLGIATGTGVLDIRRLRYADDHPIALLTNLIPLDIAPTWQELGDSGLYQAFHKRGVDIASATQEIGARGATPEEASTLGEQPGAPLLTMHRVGRTADGRAVELGEHVYRPSLYSFHFSLFTS
ncbi:DNA-binding transcriptional regulator, GntR family [Tessaracoccus bendigoensis DSM 12906]|uniref:DNA-binding transcriptional regulator, GntR family n=1 Tax=Tessaracoccus bendigoensis DSM 12906 TaxID=1123357 RepID=A0A1M6NK71_9ACTN|nr:GntR family transcriptional regulator [Tessaracoccus bendigoensis]SHJ96100.1 DNA-binding transcriptional regulator, GntR family [Tessaracoccus bendigoensis DSM 12906]